MNLLRWVCSLAAVVALLPVPAAAADLPATARRVKLDANEKPLADFLREMLASLGLTAVVDPRITGNISGRFALGGSAGVQDILSNVATSNGLTWYYDGAFVYIDPANEATSAVIAFTPTGSGRMQETLRKLRIVDPRFPVSVSEGDGTLRVWGPKRYVEQVREAVKSIERQSGAVANAEIRVFPLRYSWASDYKINRSGGQLTIPGMAATLRSLYGQRSSVGLGSSGSAAALFQLGSSRQVKLSSGDTVPVPKVEFGAPASGSAGLQDGGGAVNDAELPQIHADVRMNAVIVRDLPSRMGRYEELIKALDRRPRLVEIEVTIMDVGTDSLNRLGIDWRLHGKRFDLQTGSGDRGRLDWNSAATAAGQVAGTTANGTPLTPLGALLSAAIGSETRSNLLARVHALAQNGDANVTARPKVLTLDNVEAMLENREEFYVRVSGFQATDLFKVTAGTAVRVTPMIIDADEGGAGRGVMMGVDIEDADISAVSSVDNIPTVRRRSVVTQALVGEGTSLLIAGYTSEETTNVTTGVPVLSSMPIIGKLFQVNEKKRQKMERFYLLTPRFVSPFAPSPEATVKEAPQ